ncbi:MAG: efflux RND transporter periplasmic adaptor subunit [Campylobacterota bacterium]|nr:efflux RND transporter periplasmic adaptor subunit [Campylobacterota bacterium]
MQKIFKLIILLTLITQAQEISLTQTQLKNWQIKTAKPQVATDLPLGECIAQVTTPPSLLTTISLPFEANVKKLFVAKYQKVKVGEILAEVTGTQWIATQQQTITHAIAYAQKEQSFKRKERLCNEKIIPQKECILAKAQLKASQTQLDASKALLMSYGASQSDVAKLITKLELSPTIALRSPINGRISALHAKIGKSSNPTDALFVILQEGYLWLEADIEATRSSHLHEGQKVSVALGEKAFDTTILQLAPTLNPNNQTRHVRFLVPHNIKLLSGLRSSATISYTLPTLKIAKTSVINYEGDSIVFVQSDKGFKVVKVKILGEEVGSYFVAQNKALNAPIATTSVAILKNLIGAGDE